jgi:hypothetical protein
MLTKPFPLKSAELIKEFTLEMMKTYNEKNFYVKNLVPDDNLSSILNKELLEYNLPTFLNFLVFKRKNYFNETKTHIDYNNLLHQVVNASLIIPVEGYQDTYMYWMHGKFITETNLIQGSNTNNNVSYQTISWLEQPRLLYKEEILEPTLCRVDIPHNVSSRKDGAYRTVVTIRLNGNPSFEEIIKRRFTCGR